MLNCKRNCKIHNGPFFIFRAQISTPTTLQLPHSALATSFFQGVRLTLLFNLSHLLSTFRSTLSLYYFCTPPAYWLPLSSSSLQIFFLFSVCLSLFEFSSRVFSPWETSLKTLLSSFSTPPQFIVRKLQWISSPVMGRPSYCSWSLLVPSKAPTTLCINERIASAYVLYRRGTHSSSFGNLCDLSLSHALS